MVYLSDMSVSVILPIAAYTESVARILIAFSESITETSVDELILYHKN